MKDEIKEILDLLKYCVKKDEYLEVPNMREWKLLLDYITNLEQENEELKDYLKIMEKGKDNNLNRFLDYKSRIDKAIKYIEAHQDKRSYYSPENVLVDYKIFVEGYYELRNILTGGDE